jgi:hypothetical protein
MFYIYTQGILGPVLMATCRDPLVAHDFSKKPWCYLVSRCYDITRPIPALAIRLVK